MSDADAVHGEPEDGRDETVTERLDRNWTELLQELRVLQTGTQLLTGFLLTVAFQPVFRTLNGFERVTYLVLVLLAVTSTVLALGPVAMHRALFRRRARAAQVRSADRMLRASLAVVGAVIVGVVVLVVDVVAGPVVAAVLGAAMCAGVVVIWIVLPLRARRGTRPR